MESQRMSPNGTASLLNKKRLPLSSENTLVKAATAGIQDLPQTLNEIKKRMERDSSGANERLMARLRQKNILLHAAREEELLAQVGLGKLVGLIGGMNMQSYKFVTTICSCG